MAAGCGKGRNHLSSWLTHFHVSSVTHPQGNKEGYFPCGWMVVCVCVTSSDNIHIWCRDQHCESLGRSVSAQMSCWLNQDALDTRKCLFWLSLFRCGTTFQWDEQSYILLSCATICLSPAVVLTCVSYTFSSFRNCNHFSADLCQRLCQATPPRWINRLAYIGSWMPFVLNCLPPQWLNPDDPNCLLSSQSRSQSLGMCEWERGVHSAAHG